MEPIRVDSIVETITILRAQPEGGYEIQRLKEEGKRKKQSKSLARTEKSVRKLVKIQRRMADIYLARHDRSNRRKRDGWVKDLGKNLGNAFRKGSRKPKLTVVR